MSAFVRGVVFVAAFSFADGLAALFSFCAEPIFGVPFTVGLGEVRLIMSESVDAESNEADDGDLRIDLAGLAVCLGDIMDTIR